MFPFAHRRLRTRSPQRHRCRWATSHCLRLVCRKMLHMLSTINLRGVLARRCIPSRRIGDLWNTRSTSIHPRPQPRDRRATRLLHHLMRRTHNCRRPRNPAYRIPRRHPLHRVRRTRHLCTRHHIASSTTLHMHRCRVVIPVRAIRAVCPQRERHQRCTHTTLCPVGR